MFNAKLYSLTVLLYDWIEFLYKYSIITQLEIEVNLSRVIQALAATTAVAWQILEAMTASWRSAAQINFRFTVDQWKALRYISANANV